MNKHETNQNFPLWKVVLREFVYGRDTGSPWSDPENDIRKDAKAIYYSKAHADAEWKEEYSEQIGFEYGFHQAAITLYKLQTLHGYYPIRGKHCMFEYADRMFRLEFWSDYDKCVSGRAIDGDYWDSYNEDDRIKVDMVNSVIYLYDADEFVVKWRNVYLNGKKVATVSELAEKLGVKEINIDMMSPESVRDRIKELYPEAKTYSTFGAGGRF